jgi:hypothetical protein
VTQWRDKVAEAALEVLRREVLRDELSDEILQHIARQIADAAKAKLAQK